MSAMARICPNDWWLALSIFAVLIMLGILLLWRHRQLMRQARLRAERAAHDLEANALQESMLQSGHGLILRFEAIARRLPPDHPIRQEIVAALDRAERVLEKGQGRAQNLRGDMGGTHGPDSSKTP
jgi:ABC-type nickel/cobalt efflux system permease component RcnA